MYIETEVGGMKLEGKVDIGVDIVYIVKELADEISLPYKKEKAM